MSFNTGQNVLSLPPRSVLAVIIVVNLRGALRKFCDVPRMWRANRADAAVWLATMATSALVNTELGLLVGAAVSVLCVLGRTQRARVRELGRASGREHYEDLKCYCGLETHAGVAVLRYEAPVYFANQSLFKKSLHRTLGVDPAKERTRRVRFDKKDPAEKECAAGDASVNMMAPPYGRRSVVLDCSAVLFLDTAGVEALKEVRNEYRELGITLVLARCSPSVLDDLDRGGFFPDKKGGSSSGEGSEVFFTIADAVQHVQNLHVPNGDYDSGC